MKKIGLITAGLFLLITTACNSGNTNNANNQDKDSVNTPVENTVNETLPDSTEVKADENAPLDEEYTAKYICPNHDKGSGSDEPGDCPVCGMELIENPNYQGK
ncbi:MAG: hypothetical protein L3J74_10145 [Bacteroidales bacterium]|nr:hypothetical protein [Bacteroidales bacterium]